MMSSLALSSETRELSSALSRKPQVLVLPVNTWPLEFLRIKPDRRWEFCCTANSGVSLTKFNISYIAVRVFSCFTLFTDLNQWSEMLAENSKGEQDQPIERDDDSTDNDEEDYDYESEDYDEDYGEDEDEDYDESDEDYDYSENEDDYDYLSNDTYDYDYDYDEDEPGDETETGNSGDPEKSTKGKEV